jgi:hypothetical protein
MSLIDDGPHTVTVYLQEEDTDWRGDVVDRPSSTAVVVSGCLMQPVLSSKGGFGAADIGEGQRINMQYRLIARSAPVGPWSAVEWVDPDGNTRRFTPVGDPLVRNYSVVTRHVTANLREER